jgi:hypothetical protein
MGAVAFQLLDDLRQEMLEVLAARTLAKSGQLSPEDLAAACHPALDPWEDLRETVELRHGTLTPAVLQTLRAGVLDESQHIDRGVWLDKATVRRLAGQKRGQRASMSEEWLTKQVKAWRDGDRCEIPILEEQTRKLRVKVSWSESPATTLTRTQPVPKSV